ncbi:MAG: adenosylhomocysteinase [Chloroflexi bacterium]|nr:adenosylhomocysteinase [Chloroflexota bacterium]
MNSRIKDIHLADQIDEAELNWQRTITPVTEHYIKQTRQHDYSGKRIAVLMHITWNALTFLLALHEARAHVSVAAVNSDSTHDPTAAYLAAKGMTIYGWSGMTDADHQEHMHLMREFDADYLVDAGGELAIAYRDKPSVVGALEATQTGLNRLAEVDIPFPVFNWNSIELKNQIENRFTVGTGIWHAFSMVTLMSLFARRVLVVGYGPVGKGIAERARNLGAVVMVSDLDPMRRLDANLHGCETIALHDGLKRAQIVVTATGRDKVLSVAEFRLMQSGTIVLNAGHSQRELDIDWLYGRPHQRVKAFIERFELGDTNIYLLARGNLLNLATGANEFDNDLFDAFSAVMLRGTTWMMDGGAAGMSPGIQPYPREIEREIAGLLAECR